MVCRLILVVTFAMCAVVDAQSNRPPLQAQLYYRLPMGSVHAKSWLKHQLEIQRDGLTGNAEELYDDIGQSDWITDRARGGQYAWERGPYYARGLVALAYVLDDEGLKAKAKKWVDRVIQSQRDTGDFGPLERNWWPNMVVLYYMRDYFEATSDVRISAFIEKYLKYELAELPTHPLGDGTKWQWPKARGGDNLEIVLWMYNRTGEQWLLDLAHLLIDQTNQWSQYYADGTGDNWYPNHAVNTMQGLKTPPLTYLVTGRDIDRQGFANATRPDGWLMQKYGRIDGMLNGTEPLSNRSATEGSELCAIVERIMSDAVALRILGDAQIGDQNERVAYNALPASLMYNGQGIRYYILANQPKCTNEFLGFRDNGAGKFAICPSPNSGYPCCRSNYHIGWPAFVHDMWMATADSGLAVAAYGPNTVTAPVGADKRVVTIDQTTDYPFRETSTFTIVTKQAAAFPLELRIPSWCKNPMVRVNGEPQKGVEPGRFFRIERPWRDGDTVQAQFPMAIDMEPGENGSVAVTRGPLVYSLLIDEEWKAVRDYLHDRFHAYEIRPASDWNYALLNDDNKQPAVVVEQADTIPEQPFHVADAPVRLKLKGAKTTEGGWGSFQERWVGRAVSPPQSPVTSFGKIEDVTLVPYGSTEIRVTYFPWFKSDTK